MEKVAKRNIKRFREMPGLSRRNWQQSQAAIRTRKRYPCRKARRLVNERLIEQVAKVLKVPAEAIKNFDEKMVVFNIHHNYEGAAHNNNIGTAFICTFKPINKIVELGKSERRRLRCYGG